jgi:hypothetical protein
MSDPIMKEVRIVNHAHEIVWRLNPSYEAYRAIVTAIDSRPTGLGFTIYSTPFEGDISTCEVVTEELEAKQRIHGIIFDEWLRANQ